MAWYASFHLFISHIVNHEYQELIFLRYVAVEKERTDMKRNKFKKLFAIFSFHMKYTVIGLPYLIYKNFIFF